MVPPQVTHELMEPNVMVEIDHGPPMELRQDVNTRRTQASHPDRALSLKTNMLLRTGLTTNSATSPGSDISAFGAPSLPRRSQTSLDDVIDAHKRHTRVTLDGIQSGLTTNSATCPGSDVSAFGAPSLPRRSQTSLDDVIDTHSPRMHFILDGIGQTLTASQDEFKILVDKTKGLEGGTATRPDDSHTLMKPPQLEDTKIPGIAAIRKEQIIVIGTSCSWPMKDNSWCGWATGPHSTCRSSGNDCTSEAVQDWTASEFLSPSGGEKPDGRFLSTAKSAGIPAFAGSHMAMEQSEGIQPRGAKARGHLGLPASTSWINGPKTSSIMNAVDISTRDILMWMIEYNLMNSPCESECITRLSNQSTELLLNMVAAAISCFHVLFSAPAEKKLNAKQCTGIVHCLLKEPG